MLEVDAPVASGEVANAPELAVVPAPVEGATAATAGFFVRRSRVTMRARGSPKRPRTIERGWKPEKR